MRVVSRPAFRYEWAMADLDPAKVGSLSWLTRTGGRLSFADRFYLVAGAFSALSDGFRLSRNARRVPDGRFAFLGPFFPLIMRG